MHPLAQRLQSKLVVSEGIEAASVQSVEADATSATSSFSKYTAVIIASVACVSLLTIVLLGTAIVQFVRNGQKHSADPTTPRRARRNLESPVTSPRTSGIRHLVEHSPNTASPANLQHNPSSLLTV
jgi:hypothetical protein